MIIRAHGTAAGLWPEEEVPLWKQVLPDKPRLHHSRHHDHHQQQQQLIQERPRKRQARSPPGA
eukprot:8868158-Karenia_brevis.AAC.1